MNSIRATSNKGIASRNKKLLVVAPGTTTRNKDATSS